MGKSFLYPQVSLRFSFHFEGLEGLEGLRFDLEAWQIPYLSP